MANTIDRSVLNIFFIELSSIRDVKKLAGLMDSLRSIGKLAPTMPPKEKSYRTFYQIFIYDHTISRFHRFAWESIESFSALRRAIDVSDRHRGGDAQAFMDTLSGLSAVPRRYFVCEEAVSCAHCGRKREWLDVRCEIQQGAKVADLPFTVSIVASGTCGANKECEQAGGKMSSAKRDDVSERVREGGLQAWQTWCYAADEIAGGKNDILDLVHIVLDGKGDRIALLRDPIFFPDHVWNKAGFQLQTLQDILAGTLAELAAANLKNHGGALPPCGFCGKLSKERFSVLTASPLQDTSAVLNGAKKRLVVLQVSFCSLESRKCVQHATRILQGWTASADETVLDGSKEKQFLGALKCESCGRNETAGVRGSERIKMKRCGWRTIAQRNARPMIGLFTKPGARRRNRRVPKSERRLKAVFLGLDNKMTGREIVPR